MELAGSVAVQVRADLSHLGPGFAEARRATEQFNRVASSSLKGVDHVTKQLSASTHLADTAVRRLGAGAAAAAAPIRLNQQQLMNLQFQLNDMATMLASGQSPFVLMTQQGMQIAQLFGPGAGVGGALRAVGTGIAAFVTNPLNLAVLGIASASAAVPMLWNAITDGEKAATDALEHHNAELDRILEGYDEARRAAEEFLADASRRAEGAVASDLLAGRREAIERVRDALSDLDEEQQRIAASFGDLAYAGDVETLTAVKGLEQLGLTAKTSTAELDALVSRLTEMANDDSASDQIRKYATDLLPLIERFIEARNEVGSFDAALRAIPREIQVSLSMSREFGGAIAGIESLYMDPRSRFDVAREQLENLAAQATASAQSYGELVGAGDRYKQVLDSINAAEAEANKRSAARGAKGSPFNRWAGATSDFQAQIDQTRLQIELFGQSTHEVERQMAAFELLNQAKHAGIPITAEVTDQINALSAGYAAASVQLEQMVEAQRLAEQELAFYKSTFSSFVTGFTSNVRQGEDAWESFANAAVSALDRIADRALSMASNGIFDMLLGALMGGISGGFGGGTMGGFGIGGSTPLGFGGTGGVYLGSFASGGSGTIPGSGPTDSVLALAKVTPGERYAFGPAANSNSPSTRSGPMHLNITNHMQVMPGATEADGAAFARGVTRELRKQLPDAIEAYNSNPYRRYSG